MSIFRSDFSVHVQGQTIDSNDNLNQTTKLCSGIRASNRRRLPTDLSILKSVKQISHSYKWVTFTLELPPVLGNKRPIGDPDYFKLLKLKIS